LLKILFVEVILAALFHDIGHLLSMEDGELKRMGNFGAQNHGQLGKAFLEKCGIPYPIPDLVNNHVNAKRYLVSKHSEYHDKLTPASKQTLIHQGTSGKYEK